MSKDKKSFILYLDQQELFNKLPDEIAGKLIKHIFSYVNCENPEADDLLLDIAFSPIKQALKRDLSKWNNHIQQRVEAGKKSAAKRANDKQRKSTTVKSRSTNPTDSVSVSVSVNDSVSEVIDHLNKVINAKYKSSTKSHAENISARLNDGHSVNDLKLVIDSKSKEWASDKKMSQYLRPSTLFSAGKFQGYLMQAKPIMQSSAPKDFSQ